MSSVPKLLQGIRGRERRDYIEKLQSQNRQKQIQLESETNELIKSARRGVIPLPLVPQYEQKTAEEKVNDALTQRQTALDNLKSVFSNQNDRAAVVSQIPQTIFPGTTISELGAFNRYWNGFYDSIKGKLSNITPAFLLKLWDEYKGVVSYIESGKKNINLADPYGAVAFRKNLQDRANVLIDFADAIYASEPLEKAKIIDEIKDALDKEDLARLEAISYEMGLAAAAPAYGPPGTPSSGPPSSSPSVTPSSTPSKKPTRSSKSAPVIPDGPLTNMSAVYKLVDYNTPGVRLIDSSGAFDEKDFESYMIDKTGAPESAKAILSALRSWESKAGNTVTNAIRGEWQKVVATLFVVLAGNLKRTRINSKVIGDVIATIHKNTTALGTIADKVAAFAKLKKSDLTGLLTSTPPPASFSAVASTPPRPARPPSSTGATGLTPYGRRKILIGQIKAGNDSPLLVRELMNVRKK